MKNKTKIPLAVALLSILAYGNQGISSLPEQCLYYLTRETWKLNMGTIGMIGMVTGIAWYFKICWGIIADKINNTKNCLLVSYSLMLGVYAFICIFGLNLITLIATGLLVNIFIGFSDTVVDKQMVITEQKLKLKGRLQSIQWTALGVGGLVVALGGAWIAKVLPEPFNYKVAYGLAGLIPIAMIIYLCTRYKEDKADKTKIKVLQELKKLKNKKFLMGILFIVCLNFSPSFGLGLMAKLREGMGIDKMFLGYLGAMGTILGIVGYILYYKFAYKYPMKKLLYFMVIFSAITNLFYLYIPNQWVLVGYSIAFGAFSGLTFMSLLAYFVLIIPKGSEAIFYAIITSCNNFAARGGSWLGGIIYEAHGYNWNVIIASTFTLLCLFIIPHLQIDGVDKDEEDMLYLNRR